MRKVLSLLLALTMTITLTAQNLSSEQLYSHAQAFAGQMHHTKTLPQLSEVELDCCPGITVYNVADGGFVVACGDERARTILGYSATGAINPANLSPELAYWLAKYSDQIRQLGNLTLKDLQNSNKDLQNSQFNIPNSKEAFPDSVAPLLVTAWNQYRYGYNSECPVDSALGNTDYHPTVGCVALAMAQVMRYWQWPTHGRGSHSYSHDGEYSCWRYGTLSADFEHTTYDYANMPYQLDSNSTQAQRDAVAKLAYHCGVSVNMQYNDNCNASSGARASNQLYAMKRFFRYSPNAELLLRVNYSNANWIAKLKSDLANQRPVLYGGNSIQDTVAGTRAGGHAFVCDGYDTANYFHFDWGWQGSDNGYYALDMLNPIANFNFSHGENMLIGVVPSEDPIGIITLAENPSTDDIQLGQPVTGHYTLVNLGDTADELNIGVNVYNFPNGNYMGCVDGRHVVIQPGDTVVCSYSYLLPNLPVGCYQAVLQTSDSSFSAGNPEDNTNFYGNIDYASADTFFVTDPNRSRLSNLVVFVRFADDEEITTPIDSVNRMFNTADNSVRNYFKAISYNRLDFQTVFANQYSGSQIISYVDSLPRAAFLPYSDSNQIGYREPEPFLGMSMLRVRLIERIIKYLDNNHLVSTSTLLDGDGNGDIDNISFIVKGDVGAWMSMLWPMMDTYRHDSLGYTLTLNGKRVNTFNFQYEGAGAARFSPRTFYHEMSHSLGVPDLYHYQNYTNVFPVTRYDIMVAGVTHPAAIYKSKFLHYADAPIRITQDGTYTILSNGSSPSQNLYYIPSAIDTNQWFTIEYRNLADPFETNIRCNGLLIGRWMDTVTCDLPNGGDGFFDFFNRPNAYWVFRPGSSIDTVQGEEDRAQFCASLGRTSFGPNTDPHPYLADGTPERSFEIYDIQENGALCTFKVRFLNLGIDDINDNDNVNDNVKVVVDRRRIVVSGTQGQSVALYDMLGRQHGQDVHADSPNATFEFTAPTAGVYLLRCGNHTRKVVVK